MRGVQEAFSYPEMKDKESVEDLDMMFDQVKKFMLSVDSAAIDRDASIPSEVYDGLAQLGLFGQQVEERFGGLELSATQMSRLWEATALDASIGVTLAAHQSIGLKGILMVGTEEQKEKYLPKLASGEHIAAFCLSEPSSGSDVQSIRTRAELDQSGQFYILNGGKCWISNGSRADIMTVFAKTRVKQPDSGEEVDKITAFIVERAFGGITSSKPEDKLGIRGSNTTEVTFENVKVPVENVLGEVGNGFKLALRILNSGRFTMGAAGAGILRYLLSYATEHANNRFQFGKPIAQYGAIREKLADVACDIYAMESMSFLVAGLIDANPTRDLSLEAAAVKVFSSEASWRCASECLQVTGGLGFTKSLPFERYLRDARIMLIFEGTNEILRMLIAGSGLSYAGKELQQMLRKMKTVDRGTWRIVLFMLRASLNKKSDKPSVGVLAKPELTGGKVDPGEFYPLEDYVHPQLKQVANQLATKVVHLSRLSKTLLQKYGRELINEQYELLRVADVAIDIFMLTCCLSRCSRSLSIGLPRGEHEVLLTRAIAEKAFNRIDQNLSAVRHVQQKARIEDIADTIVNEGGYAATHPLSRTW